MSSSDVTERRWLSIKDAATYTSFSETTIRRLIGTRKIKSANPKGVRGIRIDRLELDRFMAK